MTLRSGSGQACAACKFQRRRCNSECLLAPFFPADQPQIFYNVHRLFGVKHIQKLLKDLHPHQRPIAINSVKFHAAMRHKYPVYGCLVDVQNLAYQIHLAEEELQAVLQQLVYYRQQPKQEQEQETKFNEDYLSQLQLGMGRYNLASSSSNNINGDHYNNYNKECNDVDSLWMQQTYDNNGNSMVMQSQITTNSHNMSIPQGSVQNFNEMYSFFDNIDDRQSYIGPKEVYESSLDSSVRDCTQSDEQMAENELKNAAACFSLTSFN